MKKVYLILLAFVLLNKISFSTEQIPDKLIIGHDTVCLQTFPFEDLKFKIRPFDYGNYDFPHTACWRGYQATWKVIDDKLFLIEMIRKDSILNTPELAQYFRKNGYEPNIINGLIYADWFTADLEKYPALHVNTACIYRSHNPKKKKVVLRFDKGVMIENKKYGKHSQSVLPLGHTKHHHHKNVAAS